MNITSLQTAAIEADGSSFLLGSVGTGKSTALQQRLLRLLEQGEPAYTILILIAEPEQREQYETAVMGSGLGSFADLKITPYSQLAMEMVTLFWPLLARRSGFATAHRPPTILTYDLAQLLMWRVVTPLLDGGAFADLRLRPQQIISQILDTLNRAALNSLTLEDAIERQIKTWAGEKVRLLDLRDAETAARKFRRICLQNSLLDLSLSVEVFDTQLVNDPQFHRYFSERFRHLLVDNLEEQTPAGQNFVKSLLDQTETTTLAFDTGGGYKRFMAADPAGGREFQLRSRSFIQFEKSFLAPEGMAHLANLVENYLLHTTKPTSGAEDMIIATVGGRYRREMVHNLVPILADLISGGIEADEIAIIAPYIDGALRYSLAQALAQANLPFRFLRRRSSPRDEPRVRAWLTWLALAHPQWQVMPTAHDVAEALTLSIFGLDPARAALITKFCYDEDNAQLLPVGQMPENMIERVGQETLDRVEELRLWLLETEEGEPLDLFLHRLFSELLSEQRFQPQPDVAGAAVCQWLVNTATRLRQASAAMGLNTPAEVGLIFIDGINQGLVSANPPDLGEPPDPNGITISTIYGYLLAGEPVRVQVWLETAAHGWWDIPRQPLSNAFVLAQSYDPQDLWTMTDDFKIRNELLSRIIRGLSGRCREGIILANSDLDRRGILQDGPLWRALQPAIKAVHDR
jgi:hypothetical protein